MKKIHRRWDYKPTRLERAGDALREYWPPLAMIAFGLAIVVAMVVGASRDQDQWAEFKASHACRKVSDTEMQWTSKGDVIPGQVGWLCDDGVTYYRSK